MPPRLIAIGDIHGCSAALDALIGAIEPGPDDVVVTLGDYVDRGIDSRGVIDRLIGLRESCGLVCLKGNHEQMMLEALAGRAGADLAGLGSWLGYGGLATVDSYGGEPGDVPREHLDFLGACGDLFESESHFFAHASYIPDIPLDRQPTAWLRWESLRDGIPGPHESGKQAVVGHTAQKSGEILDLGHLVCIDTYCYGGKWLTALDVLSGRAWQADSTGRMRRGGARLFGRNDRRSDAHSSERPSD